MSGNAEARSPRADLVWSGPEVAGLHARDTRQVFKGLVESAQHSLYVSTYVYFDRAKAFDALARRMEATPGLTVTLLLNIQRKRGDITAPRPPGRIGSRGTGSGHRSPATRP